MKPHISKFAKMDISCFLIQGDAQGEVFHRVDDAAVDYEEDICSDFVEVS